MVEPSAFVPGAVAQTGRVALVIGGEDGLGAVVTRALAATGHAVAIHAQAALQRARVLADELSAVGVPSLALTADLREEGPMRTIVQRAADHFGRLDALVCCASFARPCRFEDLAAADVRTHFDINIVGPIVAAQEAGTVMAGQESGGVVVMVGDAAAAQPRPGQLAVYMSLGAVEATTKCLAAEWSTRRPNIRVNCVLQDASAAGARMHVRVAHAILFLLENDGVNAVCLPIGTGRSSSA